MRRCHLLYLPLKREVGPRSGPGGDRFSSRALIPTRLAALGDLPFARGGGASGSRVAILLGWRPHERSQNAIGLLRKLACNVSASTGCWSSAACSKAASRLKLRL